MGPRRVFGMGRACKALSIERLVGRMGSVKLEFPITCVTQDKADLIIANFDHVRARHISSSAGPVADSAVADCCESAVSAQVSAGNAADACPFRRARQYLRVSNGSLRAMHPLGTSGLLLRLGVASSVAGRARVWRIDAEEYVSGRV
jgi:hypothetical protein